MLGLVVLLFIGGYLLLSGLVVWLAARWAKKRDRRPWVWGGLAAFVMYNLVFWDWLPTVVMHRYYCATQAGFWVYKTPAQWAKENPGVLETLEPWPSERIYGRGKVEFELEGGAVTQYNDRFGQWYLREPGLSGLMITRIGEGKVDLRSRSFLAKRVEFSSGPQGTGAIWKSWLTHTTCDDDDAVKTAAILREFGKRLHMTRREEW
ncbi:MAG: hypothetical protein NHG36_05055 [Chromatiaceae bacterium]|nr:hypothetical protein [Candidatus Thioaporhodococcus sediminis]